MRDQILFLTTKKNQYQSAWVENSDLIVPADVFNRLLKIWNYAPLRAKLNKRFVSWKPSSDVGNTIVTVKKALKQKVYDSSLTPKADLLWLGCYDSVEKCLGITDSVSNPNLLSNVILKEEHGIVTDSEIQDFLNRTASLTQGDLEQAFLLAQFPQSLATWYALKLLSRRASLVGGDNAYLQKVHEYQFQKFIY